MTKLTKGMTAEQAAGIICDTTDISFTCPIEIDNEKRYDLFFRLTDDECEALGVDFGTKILLAEIKEETEYLDEVDDCGCRVTVTKTYSWDDGQDNWVETSDQANEIDDLRRNDAKYI